MQKLHPQEREYIFSLKRKAQAEVLSVLATKQPRTEGPLRIRVLQSQLPSSVKQKIFEDLSTNHSEKYQQWVQQALCLPLATCKFEYCKSPPPSGKQEAIRTAMEVMDKAITGHMPAKREVLKLMCETTVPYSLGLEGPPGVGKTHFVRRALARALGRPLVSIPLGGATDASYLLGSSYLRGKQGGAPGICAHGVRVL